MKHIYNRIIFALFGFIVGTLLTGLFLYQFIASQRNQGYTEGSLNSNREMLLFLEENVKNDTTNKKIEKTDKCYGVKAYNISVVKINGIKTIQTDYGDVMGKVEEAKRTLTTFTK